MSESAHVSPRACLEYLDGALESTAARRLEQHVGSCEACARTLQVHARLEECLYQVAERSVPPVAPRVRSHRATRRASGATMSAAAAVLLMTFSFEAPRPPRARDVVPAHPADTQPVYAPDDGSGLSCLPTATANAMCSDAIDDTTSADQPVDPVLADSGALCGPDEDGRQSLCVPGESIP